jgi:molybdopterin/thiamine biosynthesis adenylyltransferase
MEGGMTRLKRQQFLGPRSDVILAGATLGLVGLGGGGSHLAQQAGHLGVGGYVLVDLDVIDDGNTNRLVGGTLADVKAGMLKTDIAARTIRGLNPSARIVKIAKTWHDATRELKGCDIIIGGLDSYIEREQLERFARRHLIPYIDIGMDVHEIGADGFLIAGQVVLSSPGHPCLRCCGIIQDEKLTQEAQKYGAAGGRPQVVWPNGVLASTAIGLAVGLLTPWHRKGQAFAYLSYDGNKGTIVPNPRMGVLQGQRCPHHPGDETGEPLFDIRKHLTAGDAEVPVEQREPSRVSVLLGQVVRWLWGDRRG